MLDLTSAHLLTTGVAGGVVLFVDDRKKTPFTQREDWVCYYWENYP